MARRIRTLTINLRDFTDTIPVETDVTMTLTGADEALPTPSEPGRQILPVTLTEPVTAGDVQFELIPTAQLKGRNRYRVSWPGITSIEFEMPDMDTTLYDILATSITPPTRPFLAPGALADGTYAVVRNNVWEAGIPIIAQDTAPAAPFQNQTVWIDTAGGADALKYWDGTAWQTVAAGGGGGGGLSQRQVDDRVKALVENFAEVGVTGQIPNDRIADQAVGGSKLTGNAVSTAKIAPNAVTTAKIADDAVTAAKIADDAVGTDQIADGSINNLHLQDAIIDNDKIEDDGIGAGKIAEAAAPDLVTALETLRGTARLDAHAIRDLSNHALSELTTHTITVGTDTTTNEFYGYRQPTDTPLGAFGSVDSTTIILGGTTYTLRENWQGENGIIRFSTTPGIPATGDYSQEDLAIEVNGHEYFLADMIRRDRILSAVAGAVYEVQHDLHTRIPRTVGDTYTLRVLTPIATLLSRGAGTGLDQTQVDARIALLVEDFAEVGKLTGRVPTARLADRSVTAAKIAVGAVGTQQLQDSAVRDADIASGAVTELKLADGAVTVDKLGANAVTSAKIADNAVGSSEIASGAVGSSEIASNAVGSSQIASDAVGSSQIASGAVGSSEIAADAVTSAKIADDAVDSGKIATGAADDIVDALESLSGTDRLEASAIQNIPVGGAGLNQAGVDARIANQVENFAEVGVAGTVPTARIADTAITTAKIADDAVTSAKIADDAIVGGQLKDDDTALGTDIVTLLSARTGASRLPATAVKDLPGAGEAAHDLKWLTVGRDGDGTNYGFSWSDDLRSIAYGNIKVSSSSFAPTFSGISPPFAAGATGWRRISQDGNGLVTIRFFGSMVATGTVSVANTALAFRDLSNNIIGEYRFADMTTTDRETFTFTAPNTLLFARTVDTQIIVELEGPIDLAIRHIRNTQQSAEERLGRIITGLRGAATPQPVAAEASVGTSFDLSRQDHVHAGVTEAEVDERISSLASNRDVIATGMFTRAATTGGGVGTDNLALTFTPASGTAITIGRIAQDTTSRHITITTTPFGTRASLVGYKISVGEDVLAFEDAAYSLGDDPPGPGINPDGYLFEQGYTAFPAGQIMVEVFEPLDEDNYVPGGGTTGQILGNTSGTPVWQAAPSGGAGLSDATPLADGTADSGDGTNASREDHVHPATDIDLDIYSLVARPSKAAAAFAEDGEINIELSAISATTGSGLSTDPATDRINVAAGTDERAYTVDCVYDVQPTAYQNNDTSGGNRVWIEFYAKKNGNDILASHDTKYMRHRNPWAPTSQTFNMSFDTTLTANDNLTFHFRRRGTYGQGAEIERWQINGTTSFVGIQALDVSGSAAGSGGGPSGQANEERTIYVHQWKKSATKPAVSELAPSVWSNTGWTTLGTPDWFGSPDGPTGTETLWHSLTTATYDGSSWTLGTWSDPQISDEYSVRYYDSTDGTGTATRTPSASTRSFQRRDPTTGQWGAVLAFGAEALFYNWFVNTNMSGITSSTSSKVVTFPAPVDFAKVRDIRASVQLYSGSQLVLYGDAYLAPRSPFNIASSGDLLVQPNERINLRASTTDGVKLFVGSSVIGNHGSGSTTDFECDFYFRQTASATDGPMVAADVRFYRFGSWNQNAVVQLFWR